jgi:hypothetical protein
MASSAAKDRRRRAYNRRVRQLTEPEQEALARAFYEHIWPAVSPYLGASGQPSPLVSFVPDSAVGGNGAWVNYDDNGIRHVYVSSTAMQLMIYKSAGGVGRLGADRLLAHEWRHVFQNASLLDDSSRPGTPHDAQPVEQDAMAFAKKVVDDMKSRQRINRQRKREGKPPVTFPVPPVLGPENIKDNLGKDPRTIPYPEASPSTPKTPMTAGGKRSWLRKENTAALQRLARSRRSPHAGAAAAELARRSSRPHSRLGKQL